MTEATIEAERVAEVGPSSRALSEATTVARAQDGDTAAFEKLMSLYQAELLRLAYRMLHDRGEAEDVVQDTFVLMWRRLPTLTAPNAFHGWIYQIATRGCLQVLRSRTRKRTDLTDGTGEQFEEHDHAEARRDGSGPELSAEGSAQQASLDAALAELPADQRACWVLRNLHGLDYVEIAQATGTPVSTVRGRLARAKKSLAVRMAPWR